MKYELVYTGRFLDTTRRPAFILHTILVTNLSICSRAVMDPPGGVGGGVHPLIND